jgi:hypothetical protein
VYSTALWYCSFQAHAGISLGEVTGAVLRLYVCLQHACGTSTGLTYICTVRCTLNHCVCQALCMAWLSSGLLASGGADSRLIFHSID